MGGLYGLQQDKDWEQGLFKIDSCELCERVIFGSGRERRGICWRVLERDSVVQMQPLSYILVHILKTKVLTLPRNLPRSAGSSLVALWRLSYD